MRSSRPKPLHLLCGRAMLLYVLDSLTACHVSRVVVVVGAGMGRLQLRRGQVSRSRPYDPRIARFAGSRADRLVASPPDDRAMCPRAPPEGGQLAAGRAYLANRVTPAHGDERAQVVPLLDAVKLRTGKRGRPRKRLKVIATDKGYDAQALRQQLRKRGIRAQIPKRVWKTKKNRGRPIKKAVPRFQAERTFAWFQQKDRRLVVRWERLAACFEAFLTLATVHIWIHRLIVG